MHGGLFTPRPEDAIHARIEGWCEAVRARDVESIAAYYAPGILAFDAVSSLRFEGLDANTQHWRDCLASGEGEMIFEVRDIAVTAGVDLAFAHFLNRSGRRDGDGWEDAVWLRVTLGYRKHLGQWLIVHEHVSVPFDLDSHEALIDLHP